MQTITRANWWAMGALAFCVLVWGVGVFSVSKTAHLYANRSHAGFRHDVVAKARERWVGFKQSVGAPATKPAESTL
jgi:hypothetical protein